MSQRTDIKSQGKKKEVSKYKFGEISKGKQCKQKIVGFLKK